MKIVFVLLGIVAIAAAVPQERGIIDTVGQLVSNFSTQVFGSLDKVIADVKSLTSSTIGRGNGIVSSALGQITSMTATLEKELNDIVARGGQMKTCALNQVTQLSNIKTSAVSRVTGCASDVSDAVVSFEQDIVQRVNDLKSSVTDLVGLAKDCTKNILDAVTCAISKINAGKLLVDDITDNINGALVQARTKADNTVAGVQSCATSTVNMVTQQFQQIGDNLKRCI